MPSPGSLPGLKRPGREHLGWAAAVVLLLMLWGPAARMLAEIWRSDSTLSHGPILALIVVGLFWVRRRELPPWRAASKWGLIVTILFGILHVGAVWIDSETLNPLTLLGLTAGGIWFLGGREALRLSLGPLGLLLFAIPWSTLPERLTFPMQLTSTAYAATFAGILGLPIHREGVHLFVQPDLHAPPIYSVVVAKQCSGLTSLLVLLALGYLIAFHTRTGWGWRALLVLLVLPLTLLTNAVRLTLILVAGTYQSAALAQWVHDHEAPFLIFLCSIALLAIRAALLAWTKPRATTEARIAVQVPAGIV